MYYVHEFLGSSWFHNILYYKITNNPQNTIYNIQHKYKLQAYSIKGKINTSNTQYYIIIFFYALCACILYFDVE